MCLTLNLKCIEAKGTLIATKLSRGCTLWVMIRCNFQYLSPDGLDYLDSLNFKLELNYQLQQVILLSICRCIPQKRLLRSQFSVKPPDHIDDSLGIDSWKLWWLKHTVLSPGGCKLTKTHIWDAHHSPLNIVWCPESRMIQILTSIITGRSCIFLHQQTSLCCSPSKKVSSSFYRIFLTTPDLVKVQDQNQNLPRTRH